MRESKYPEAFLFLLAVIALSFGSRAALGQEEPEEEAEAEVEEAVDAPVVQRLAQLGYIGGARDQSDQEGRLTKTLEVDLADVERVCQLDEKQLMKLRIAIKGAVEQHLRDPNAQQNGFGFHVEHGGMGQAEGGGNVVMRFSGTGIGTPDVTEEAIWVKAVQSVLTEEQKKAYARELAERQAYRREAMTRYLVSAVDRDLRLSAQQREQLAAALAETLKGDGLRQLELLDVFVTRMGQGLDPDLFCAVFLVPDSKAQEVLTDLQWARWCQVREGEMAQRFGFDFGKGDFEIREEDESILIIQRDDG